MDDVLLLWLLAKTGCWVLYITWRPLYSTNDYKWSNTPCCRMNCRRQQRVTKDSWAWWANTWQAWTRSWRSRKMRLMTCVLSRPRAGVGWARYVMRGIVVSTSAFLASVWHQCWNVGSSLLSLNGGGALVFAIFRSSSVGVFSWHFGFLSSFIG